MALKIEFMACDRYTCVAGLDWLMGHNLPFFYDNWISDDNTDINKP